MNQSVKQVFNSYPEKVETKMVELRKIILDVVETLDTRNSLEETLKWGEPSYLLKHGSTVRIDWKESNPKYLGIFFNCRTKLIDTFRAIYGKDLKFEGNRAILLELDSSLPEEILFQCIHVALTYHKRKKLPLLGL